MRLQNICIVKCLQIHGSPGQGKPLYFADFRHELGGVCLWRETGAEFNLSALKAEEEERDLRDEWKGEGAGRWDRRAKMHL